MSAAVRVELPSSLCRLAGLTHHELSLTVAAPVTQRTVLDALEARLPSLQGTIRDHTTALRRPFIRFFAGGEDISHASPDAPLPEAVARGDEPFLILAAIAGG